MLGDLSPDIIGTNPKYIPIINQEWLTPDTNTYDNYPSDNNSVRIQPKLGEMWNNHIETGLNLVPNSVSTMPCHNAGMSEKEIKASVIREAKKAMMAGLSGGSLAEHIRSRFVADDIVLAKDELTKLSEEQGLLGNVYIDASAFVNASEAEQFLNHHRTRLARFIVVGEGAVSKSAAHFLANKFRKNVVTAMEYNDDVFARYKMHLVEANKIGNAFVIDSKETLRAAFMAQPMERQSNFVPNRKKEYSEEEVLRILSADTEKMARPAGFLKDAEEVDFCGLDSVLSSEPIKLGSLSELSDFYRASKDTLVHKAEKDLWKIKENKKGEVIIERLFQPNSNEPIKI